MHCHIDVNTTYLLCSICTGITCKILKKVSDMLNYCIHTYMYILIIYSVWTLLYFRFLRSVLKLALWSKWYMYVIQYNSWW